MILIHNLCIHTWINESGIEATRGAEAGVWEAKWKASSLWRIQWKTEVAAAKMLLNWKESKQEVWAVCWFLYSFAKLLSMSLKGNVQITSSSWANTFPWILCLKVLLKIKFSFCMLKPFWWIDGEVCYILIFTMYYV